METAGQEVDQTLALARDRVELQIARYRVWMYAAITALTLITRLALTEEAKTPLPTIYFFCCVLYASGLQTLVRRYGAREWLILGSLTLDLCAAAGIFVILRALGGDNERATGPQFVSHVLGVELLLVLLVNLLRGHARAAIVGAGVASVLALCTTVYVEGFMPAQIPLSLGFWITGIVGVAAAKQGRVNLQSFARLQLLRRYLSPTAVERVMRDSPDAAMALGGQLLTVTLLSADLRGFTAMSEKLSPEEVVRQLNAFHGAMLEEIEAHGGSLDKFIGDGILVVFGLERIAGEAGDPGAARAVACAQAMLRRLELHNAERASRSETPLKMGIGVHTGPVVAGNIGAPGRRLEFTVIGDAVNTASRLEGLTKEAGAPLLISADTIASLGESAHGFTELTPMAVKGKTEPLRVFRA